MRIETRQVGDVYILDMSGKITLGEGTMAVRCAVSKVLKRKGKKIILNLASVNYIDQSGVGELVSSFTTVENEGGILKLLSVSRKIKELLEITKLLSVFQVFDNEPEALASFAAENN